MCYVCWLCEPIPDKICTILGIPTGRYWYRNYAINGNTDGTNDNIFYLLECISSKIFGMKRSVFYNDGLKYLKMLRIRNPKCMQIAKTLYKNDEYINYHNDWIAVWLKNLSMNTRVYMREHEDLTPTITLYGVQLYEGVKYCTIDSPDERFYIPEPRPIKTKL